MIGASSLDAANRPRAFALILVIGVLVAGVGWRTAGRSGENRGIDRKWLRASLAAEVIMIAAGMAYCMAANRADLILPIIALAVGLHFFPMARAYRNAALTVIGVLTTLVALISLACPVPQRSVVLGFGIGCSFWALIAFTLVRQATRKKGLLF